MSLYLKKHTHICLTCFGTIETACLDFGTRAERYELAQVELSARLHIVGLYVVEVGARVALVEKEAPRAIDPRHDLFVERQLIVYRLVRGQGGQRVLHYLVAIQVSIGLNKTHTQISLLFICSPLNLVRIIVTK